MVDGSRTDGAVGFATVAPEFRGLLGSAALQRYAEAKLCVAHLERHRLAERARQRPSSKILPLLERALIAAIPFSDGHRLP